jgi:hypothetical protein
MRPAEKSLKMNVCCAACKAKKLSQGLAKNKGRLPGEVIGLYAVRGSLKNFFLK